MFGNVVEGMEVVDDIGHRPTGAGGPSTAACRSSRSRSRASKILAIAALSVTTLFISDLHLDAGEPETIGVSSNSSPREAIAARALYILGDLFEAWIGDDDDDPRLRR